MTHVMDAIRAAIAEVYAQASEGAAEGIREDLLAVLRHLPRELTVGEMLRELEES